MTEVFLKPHTNCDPNPQTNSLRYSVSLILKSTIVSLLMRLWYIISDIHGSYQAFRNLLLHAQLIDESNRWIGGEACLFLLGDYVTSGPDSKQVIDLIRLLECQVPHQVIALLGNHELLLLRAIHDKHHRQQWLANPDIGRR